MKFFTLFLCLVIFISGSYAMAAESRFLRAVDVVWCEMKDQKTTVFHSNYQKKKWSEKEVLYVSFGNIINPSIVRMADDSLIVMWSLLEDEISELYFMQFKDGKWNTPALYNTGMAFNGGAVLLLDTENVVRAFWVGNNGFEDDIFCGRWLGKTWSSPLQINTKDESPDILPLAGLDDGQVPWVVWTGYSSAGYKQYVSKLVGKNQWTDDDLTIGSTIISIKKIHEEIDKISFPDFTGNAKSLGVTVQDEQQLVKSYRIFR